MNLNYTLDTERSLLKGVRGSWRMGMVLWVQFPGKQTLGQRLTLGYAFRTDPDEGIGQQNRTEGETIEIQLQQRPGVIPG